MPSIKNQALHAVSAIDELKVEARTKNFISLTPDEIQARLKTGNDPWFGGFGFDPDTAPGGKIAVQTAIFNPGSSQVFNLYVHVWVGSGIRDPSAEPFLLNVDTRFPRLTELAFSGATVDPHSAKSLFFTLEIPTAIDKTKYFLCGSLLQLGGRTKRSFDSFMSVFEVA